MNALAMNRIERTKCSSAQSGRVTHPKLAIVSACAYCPCTDDDDVGGEL